MRMNNQDKRRCNVLLKGAVIVFAAWAFFSMGGGGCGEIGGRNLGPLLVVVTYHGSNENMPLVELKFHSYVDDYRAAPNVLEGSSLGIGESIELDNTVVDEGSESYITAVRKLYDLPQSDMVALTSEEPFAFNSGRYDLWVADECFRLYDPVRNFAP